KIPFASARDSTLASGGMSTARGAPSRASSQTPTVERIEQHHRAADDEPDGGEVDQPRADSDLAGGVDLLGQHVPEYEGAERDHPAADSRRVAGGARHTRHRA